MDGGQVAREHRPERREGCPAGHPSLTPLDYWGVETEDQPIAIVRCPDCGCWACQCSSRAVAGSWAQEQAR